MRALLAAVALAAAVAAPNPSRGESGTLALTPDETQVHFELDATLHTVEGSLRMLRAATLEFDAASGKATGEVALDARSAETGNDRRDRTLKDEVLECERYPEIVFTAERIELTRTAPDRGDVVLTGRVRIHGDEHPLRIPAHLERDGDAVHVTALFRVPYVEWGMKDVSNLVLRVGKDVAVRLDAITRYEPGP
ncbi:MAG TPA: YceI family protein [Myxococcota bacterium]|nr:YceI family protein [Myxococcota bacterium]